VSNAWFETVAEAQRRARKRLPASVYAALIGGDPAAFAGFYRWDVYCRTTAGDVLLPIGYAAASPIPAADYVASHPQ